MANSDSSDSRLTTTGLEPFGQMDAQDTARFIEQTLGVGWILAEFSRPFEPVEVGASLMPRPAQGQRVWLALVHVGAEPRTESEYELARNVLAATLKIAPSGATCDWYELRLIDSPSDFVGWDALATRMALEFHKAGASLGAVVFAASGLPGQLGEALSVPYAVAPGLAEILADSSKKRPLWSAIQKMVERSVGPKNEPENKPESDSEN